MKTLYDSKIYIEELKKVASDPIFKELEGKTILITGGTGLVLSYFVDAILNSNIKCIIFLVVRNFRDAMARFSSHVGDPRLQFIEKELSDLASLDRLQMDYVIAGASRTNPVDCQNRPVEVLMDNLIGAKNALSVASNYVKSKFLLLSTTKVYGLNKDALNENDFSLINSMSTADILGFSKLAAEKLTLAYSKEHNVDVSIARLSRTFGPTLKYTDTKEISEFYFETLNGDDIYLHTEGTETIPFHYVGDAVRAICYILVKGENGLAYNVGPEESFELLEIAETIGTHANKEVQFSENKKPSPKTSKTLLSIEQIKKLGFENKFNLKESLKQTYDILKDIY